MWPFRKHTYFEKARESFEAMDELDFRYLPRPEFLRNKRIREEMLKQIEGNGNDND